MTRQLSTLCFSMALSSSLLMKWFAVQEELVGLAVFSVVISAMLANLMWIRFMGIAGVGGLCLVYFRLGGSSLPGAILTIVTTTLLVAAVALAICSDLSQLSNRTQGE